VKVAVGVSVGVSVGVKVGVSVGVKVAVAVSVGVAVTTPAQKVTGLDRFCGSLGAIRLKSEALSSVS